MALETFTDNPAKKGAGYCLLLLFLTLLIAVLATPASAEERIGGVEELQVGAYGTSEVRGRVLLALADPVFKNEHVETLPEGALSVRFNDETVFHLGGNSAATLDSYIYDADAESHRGLIELGQGVFRFISSSKNDEGLKFSTHNAIIGVRGTDFFVIRSADGPMRIGTVSGLVDIAPEGAEQAIELQPGFYARLGEDPGDIVVRDAPVRPADLACWLTGDDHICNAVPRSFAKPATEGRDVGPEGGDGRDGLGGAGGRANNSQGQGGRGNRSGGADGTNPGGAGNDSGSSNPGG